MQRFVAPLVLIVLAACGAWPDLPESDAPPSQDYPALVPLSDVLPGEGTDPEPIIDEVSGRSESLNARAETLSRRTPNAASVSDLQERAELLREPLEDEDAFERLRERLRR